MREKLILLGMVLVYCFNTNAQKIKNREFDKFTKKETITTSVETLYTRTTFLNTGEYKFKFYIKKTEEDSYTMFATISTPECEKYSENSGVRFLLSNGDVVELQTLYTGVSGLAIVTTNRKVYAFETAFVLSSEDVKKMKEFEITDVRVLTIDGYHDHELKEKKRGMIKRMLSLLDE